jgi:hypothetical protein
MLTTLRLPATDENAAVYFAEVWCESQPEALRSGSTVVTVTGLGVMDSVFRIIEQKGEQLLRDGARVVVHDFAGQRTCSIIITLQSVNLYSPISVLQSTQFLAGPSQ